MQVCNWYNNVFKAWCITMLAGYTRDLLFYESCKSSPTWSSRPVQNQPNTLNGNSDINFIRRRIETFFDTLGRRRWNLSFDFGPSSISIVDHSKWSCQSATPPALGWVGPCIVLGLKLKLCAPLQPGPLGRPNPRTSLNPHILKKKPPPY